jgi:hypothetical protein
MFVKYLWGAPGAVWKTLTNMVLQHGLVEYCYITPTTVDIISQYHPLQLQHHHTYSELYIRENLSSIQSHPIASSMANKKPPGTTWKAAKREQARKEKKNQKNSTCIWVCCVCKQSGIPLTQSKCPKKSCRYKRCGLCITIK